MISFSGIAITKISEDAASSSAVFEIGPLPKGYGYTLGNSLRRVLLSSLEGAAITSIRINNLDHEFTTIPGVRQNILDIVLRLKNVRVRLNSGEQTILTMSKKGIGQVLASDFVSAGDVTVVNKDYVVADLTDASAQLTIEAVVEQGIGYKRAEESLRDEIGRIPVDSLFSPVLVADAKILPSRKGARTDLDKIVLNVTTDGTITPEEAIMKAVKTLRTFYEEMDIVANGAAASVATTSTVNPADVLLSTLEVSQDVVTLLEGAGITTIEQVVAKPKAFYQDEVGLKAKQIKEIETVLKSFNLALVKDEKKSKKTKS
jgi:DNA-directed RNA polymerase subunit alpha